MLGVFYACTEEYKHNNCFLKVQSCKLLNDKYTITLTQITNTKIVAFIAVLVFNLLSRKVFFIDRKDRKSC